ncbi:hypothetical protein [Amycolatopsis minnesotensis]
MIMTTTWLAFAGLQTAVAYAASVSPPAERGRNIGVVTPAAAPAGTAPRT